VTQDFWWDAPSKARSHTMPTKKEREIENEKVIKDMSERLKKVELMLEALLAHAGLGESDER
jgi:hypothetical protein